VKELKALEMENIQAQIELEAAVQKGTELMNSLMGDLSAKIEKYKALLHS
jgi:hypothetical protein